MAFEVFVKTTTRYTSPMISVSGPGRVTFNKSLAEQLEEKKIEKILILYDRETRKIAFRVAKADDYRAYQITFNDKKNSAFFHAKPFFDKIRYDLSKPRQFPVTYDALGENKQWVIALDNLCFVKKIE